MGSVMGWSCGRSSIVGFAGEAGTALTSAEQEPHFLLAIQRRLDRGRDGSECSGGRQHDHAERRGRGVDSLPRHSNRRGKRAELLRS